MKKMMEKILDEQRLDADEDRLLDEIVLIARNYGEFYKAGDPKGAVKKAIKDLKKIKSDDLDHMCKQVEKSAAKDVKDLWNGK